MIVVECGQPMRSTRVYDRLAGWLDLGKKSHVSLSGLPLFAFLLSSLFLKFLSFVFRRL
jgi:hypothetical protein